ncbi:putative transmembrane protein [Gregarina niphandrodes]|uniref:Transmembrane protein n=1 Tax=Gregarina niphandrodes TaxID=110365 RepID=A0A023AZQ8_GRENI|nr:putative transmembrane protein [Gregarina niphandrodes]EZG44372.1 putative transmembrane protein [Gregarina niphandrodes]|eukprot:XP_011132687.1 putative transmembrane protein [Gregarina niphandrodes]
MNDELLRQRRREEEAVQSDLKAPMDDLSSTSSADIKGSPRRCACNRSEGCFCGNHRILSPTLVAIPGLIFLLLLFLALFAVGAAIAFYLTNTTFAILDNAAGSDTESTLAIENDTILVDIKVPLFTYVPSLVPIPISSKEMTVSFSPISNGSSLRGMELGANKMLARNHTKVSSIKEELGAPLRSRREPDLYRSKRVLSSSVFDHVLLSEHKATLLEHGRKLSASLPRLPLEKLNQLKDSKAIREPVFDMPKTRGTKGWLSIGPSRAPASWPRTADLTETMLTADGVSIQKMNERQEADFLTVEWEDWQGHRQTAHLSLSDATGNLKTNTLQDARMTPPKALLGFLSFWSGTVGTSRLAETTLTKRLVDEINVTKRSNVSDRSTVDDRPRVGSRSSSGMRSNVEAAGAGLSSRRRVLESRGSRPRSVHIRVESGKGSRLSWWSGSILATVMESCAEEARQAAEFLASTQFVDDLEIGSSCGERWLLHLSDPDLVDEQSAEQRRLDGGAVALGVASHLVDLSHVFSQDDGFDVFIDPFVTRNFLSRGLADIGSVIVKGTVQDAAIASVSTAGFGSPVLFLVFVERL